MDNESRKVNMTTFKAAEALDVSITTVQKWIEKGVIHGWKTSGGHRRVNADEVMELAAKRKNKKSAAINVLVIEDDPDICRLYELMSRNWSIPTALHFAQDGLNGLIAIGRLQPDFVIVDLNIPQIDGFQLVKTLSSQFNSRVFRYCVVTGLPQDEINARGRLPDECPVLGKPINFSTLENLICNAYADVCAQRTTLTT